MHAPTLCASLTACPQPCSHALTHAPAAEPTEDAEAEAAAAVSALTDCDVVLTSYAVLQQEVHYSPSSGTLGSLRHAKRYKVRVGAWEPSLLPHKHRLLLDCGALVCLCIISLPSQL